MSVQIDGSTGNIIAIKADYSGDVSIGGTLTYEDVTNIDAVGLITARSGVKFGASGTTVVGNSSGIGVGTDNPGSNKLQVQGSSALYGNGGVSAVWGDTSYLGALSFDGSAQPVIRTASSKALIFQVNQSTEALRITSSGDLCFGSTVGANNDGSGISIYNASNPRLSFRNSTTGNTTSDGSQLYLVNSDLYVTNNENANLILRTNSTERMRIDNSGDYLFLGGTLRIKNAANDTQYGALYADASNFHINAGVNNLLLYTGGGERARIDSSGRLMLGTTTEGYSSGDDLTIATSGHTGITLRSGTTSEGAVYFSDATSGGGEYVGSLVYSHNTNNMLFTANGAERFRIESDGDIKFGTQGSSVANNSTALTHIDAGREYWSGTAGDYRALKHRLYYVGTDDAYGMGVSASLLEIQSQTDIAFFAGSAGVASGRRAERLRLDNSGRLLLGTTTSRTMGGHGGALQVSGTDFSTATVNITNNANSSNGAYLFFSKQRSGSAGGNTILQSGDLVGQIRWLAADGTDIDTPLATIDGLVDGTPGSNDMPGRLTFSTTADGANAPTERMRIANDGKFFYATTSQGPHGGFFNIDASSSGRNGLNVKGTTSNYVMVSSAGGTTGDHIFFSNYSNSNQETGRIKDNQSNVTYHTSSDYRLKDNIVSITDGITRVKQLNPVRHTWINNPSLGTVDGWIAHELDAVCPDAVDGVKDAVKEDGSINPQAVDYGRITPLLAAALKEAIAKIETLETKVAALEG